MDRVLERLNLGALSPAAVLSSHRALIGVFAGTLVLSALLLFSVQPMFARMALPLLGGTPAVWAVSMCFFQAALLAGYCYAHALIRFVEPRRAVLIHVTLLAITFLALPIGLPKVVGTPPEGDAYFWLLSVLALGVGLPFFAVSATAPMLQAWFAKTGHKDAEDPYFLYGASNFGSLAALLAYPVFIEPGIGLSAQSHVWQAGFVILALMIAFCGALMLRAANFGAGTPAGEADERTQAGTVTWSQRALWMTLAALPSALMVAVTTYITTDIASAPFIWVVPLALYLVTFILVFKDELPFDYKLATDGLPLAILALMFIATQLIAVFLTLTAFFFAALVCHRELYLERPSHRHLTEFYLYMSAGGVIGGIFSALIAPQIFASTIEFKLLLLAALLCRPGVLLGLGGKLRPMRLAAICAAMAAVLAAYKGAIAHGLISGGGPVLYALCALVPATLYLTRRWPEHRAVLVATMVIALAAAPGDIHTLYLERSFFGTLRVMETDSGQHRLMLHGTTIHGAQRVRTAEGAPVTEPVPATYYHAQNPMARGLGLVRRLAVHDQKPFSIGVVGLGTGSLACFSQPGEAWGFYEIDPMVARVARNPAYFNFLSRCLPDNKIIIGDARLTLQNEPQAAFDYLIIDAFSSDAIPVHLLTREALESYFDKLSANGVLALHISNRYLDLKPVLAATAATLPGVKSMSVAPPSPAAQPDATPSRVVFLSKNAYAIEELHKLWPDGEGLEAQGVHAWTDDYSDVLGAFIRQIKQMYRG